MDKSQKALSSIVIYNKYAKYLPDLKRRETWDEIIERYLNMIIKKYPKLKDEILEKGKFLYEKKVLPSMRALQFAGPAIDKNHARLYNCAYLPIESYTAFSEIMFLLLGGSGVGYSVQYQHIDKLPEIQQPLKERKFLIGDSIEGWADAVKALMKAYFGITKTRPRFDYSDIRPKGARLVTAGGKAPGPEPLKICLTKIEAVLKEKPNGSKLTDLEAHDVICHIADAVLAGGIRRAALISLFSMDSKEMATCKHGNWWELNPQRGRANNSAVIVRNRASKEDFMGLWEMVKDSGSGEPGIYWTNDPNYGTNPCCIVGDTWIETNQGAMKAKDLVGNPFKALVDGNLYNTTSNGFWKTGKKEVFEVTTKKGFKFELTADHKLEKEIKNTRKSQVFEWKELRDLDIGDSIRLSNHRSMVYDFNIDDYKKGWLIGSLIGDGTITEHINKTNNAHLDYWGNEKYELGNIALNDIKSLLKARSDMKLKKFAPRDKTRVSSTNLYNLAEKYGVVYGHKYITDKIEKSSKSLNIGVLQGLFDADGSVQGSTEKGISVRLTQSNLELLERVQRMLARFGIISSIYMNRHEEGYRNLPDGKGGLKPFYCKATHELIIAKDNIQLFAKIIGFRGSDKMNKLLNLLSTYKREPNKEKFSDKIVSVISKGVKSVYDVTIDKVHKFDGNGVSMHNCEISLRPYTFCNLCEINAGTVIDQLDFDQRAEVAALFGTLQAGFTDFHYLRNAWKHNTEKDSLIGVGITGICNGLLTNINLEETANLVKKENKRVAKIIGINTAARTTTVKPSGTTSCVVGTSSGVHEWYSKYYIRNIQCSVGDDLYNYFTKHHPELIKVMDYDPRSAVIGIPQRTPDTAILRDDVNAIEFLERVDRFNRKWVHPGHRKGPNTNNVSATCSVNKENKYIVEANSKGFHYTPKKDFKIKDQVRFNKIFKNEWYVVGEWMWENKNNYNGLSVLPYDGGTYKDAPFQTCTEEEYNEKIKLLENIDLTKIIEESDNTSQRDTIACGPSGCEIL